MRKWWLIMYEKLTLNCKSDEIGIKFSDSGFLSKPWTPEICYSYLDLVAAKIIF